MNRSFNSSFNLAVIAAITIHGAACADTSPPFFDAPWIGYDTAVYPEGLWPHAGDVGDFNGDGFPDYATTSWSGTPYLSVMMNDGKGGYLVAEQYALDLESQDLVARDFDNDGDVDIVVAESGRRWEGLFISYWRNDGAGGFTPSGMFSTGDDGPSGICAADFDGDGFMDVAVTHDEYINRDNSVSIILNNGGNGFGPPRVMLISSGTHDLDCGDLDGDGDPDIAVAHETNRWTFIRNNSELGTFEEVGWFPGITAGSIPEDPTVHIGDVDNDGSNDVIFSNQDSGGNGNGAIGLWRNDGTGGFPLAETISLLTPEDPRTGGARHVHIADVTHDGWPDILAGNGYWFLIEGDGAGGFLPARLFHAGDMHDFNPQIDIDTADMDLDGDLDIIVLANGSLEACVYLNPGQGEFIQPTPIPMSDPNLAPTFARDIEVADIDSDGDLDLVSGYRGDFADQNALTVRRNNGDGTFGPIEEYIEFNYPADLVLRDMDGDGDVDLLYVDENSRFHIRKNDGAGNFGPRLSRHSFNAAPERLHLDAVDIDNDGDLDVTTNTGFTLAVSLNQGGDSYAAPYDAADYGNGFASNSAFGDFNEDGLLDLLSDSGAQGFPAISFNLGNGFFGPPNTVSTGRDVKAMDVGDLDNDGHLDFVSLYNLDEVGLGVRRGRGDGNFFLPAKYPGAYYFGDHTSTVDLVDFDGDGILDAVTTSFGAQDFSFWRGRGDGRFDDDIRYGVGWAAHDIEPGDFNGDGILDVAVICQVDNGRWWYPGVVIIEGRGNPTGETALLRSVEVVTGAQLGGGLPDLLLPDDSYLHTRSGFGSTLVDLHHMEMRVTATTTVGNPAALDLLIEDRINQPAGLGQLRLHNFSTGSNDFVGGYPIGSSDAQHQVTGIAAANYVNALGEIEVSIKHIVIVPFLAFTFESFIDQIEIIVQ